MRTRAEWESIYGTMATSLGFSISTSADWLLIRNMVVNVSMILEGIVTLFKSDVDADLANKQPGSLAWYPQMISEYQHGDTLIVEDGVIKYATVDENLQIIAQRSVKENDSGILDIKLAKDDGTGLLVALDNTELTGATNYINARKAPGVGTNIVTRDADTITYTMIGKFSKNYPQADIETALDAAFEAHKLTYNTVKFDGTFFWGQLYEDLMAVPGMVNISSLIIDIVYGIGGGISDVTDEAELPAGYFNWDAGSTKTLTAV